MKYGLTRTKSISPGDGRKRVDVAYIFIAFAICLLSGGPLFAQFESAQINGTIRDSNGAVIANAMIQIKNSDTGFTRETVTNSTGTYVLPQIPPGNYTVTVKSTGFTTATRAAVALTVGQTFSLDFDLRPGSSTETVTVSATAAELQTTWTDVGATLDSDAVNSLPLLGRNYTQLLVLQTGVSPVNNDQTGGRTQPPGPAVLPSIQGQNNRSNVYRLDGTGNNEAISGDQIITPIPDDIQAMKVVTHSDNAQYGQGLGGTINLITKSGTNQLHGGAWEYWRSSEFFDAKQPLTGDLFDMHQNQFGFNIGGPVVLPHLYNGRDRTFFYGSYEGFRQKTASESIGLVPTAAQLQGDFSALLTSGTQIYNPYTGAPFLGNQIPSDMIDQNMLKFAQAVFPAPNGSYLGGAANYKASTPISHTSNQFDIRGDEYLTEKDQIWAHFLRQSAPAQAGYALPNLLAIFGYTGYNFGAQWTHTFGPSSVLTVGFGKNVGTDQGDTVYSGAVQSLIDNSHFSQGFACNFKFGLRSSGCMLPGVGIGSYIGGGEGHGSPVGLSHVSEYKADYMQNFGRHTLYVGFDIATNNQGVSNSASSSENFSPFQTSQGGAGGNELASFLLGLPDSASKRDTRNVQSGGWVNGFYGQDQWKLRDNLTLNIGLRYDVSIIPNIKNQTLGAYYDIFDFNKGVDVIQNMPPACSATQFAPCLPGGSLPDHVVVSSKPGTLFFSDWTNIQPRVGLAYQFRPNFVLHASYGRTYDNWAAVEQSAQNINGWLMQAQEQASNLNTDPNTTHTTAEDPLSTFTGNYPSPTPFGSVAWNTRPQFRNAYSDQWTFGFQQSVKTDNIWTINYVGSAGRNLDYAPVANTAMTPGPGPIAPRTPFPYMGQSFYDQPIGKLDYNALQTSFQGRNRTSGLTYLFSYTWSKGINFGADGWYGIGTTSIQDPYHPELDRSVTGYDLPHVFTFGLTWAVPIGHGHYSTGNHFVDYILGNWQLDGIGTLESGRPFTVEDSGDIANTGNFSFTSVGYERPNLIANPSLSHPTPQEWFNTSAFATPPQYTFGNAPRNSLRTDPYKNLDLSLFREFPFYEEAKLQFRLDAFNSFNHPVWGVPNSCQNCAAFGVVTSTINNARQLQLSGKIVF